ncbi:MAG: PEP-CTERM sorting domain-containing protein [Okeania sp. SIO3H1]|nr:PEP-CTERM sorting domain-containing protein [Okeania sp. SIO3H1]
MKNQIVASIAALPLALGTVFAGAGVAEATALTGQFQLSSGISAGGLSNIFLTENSLYFEPVPTPIAIDADTDGGTFSAFNTAYISNIITFSPFVATNPFLDLGSTALPGVVTGPEPSLTDGLNIFNLDEASFRLSQTGANVSVEVDLWGDFVSETGETTRGAGSLTFQINNDTVASVQQQLDNGETIGDMTFSGGLFSASVPEPATLFGLGVVTAGLVTSRRQKKS